MRGQCFNNSEKAVETYKIHVSAMSLSDGINVLMIGLFKCKNAAGENFEKQ